MGEPSDTALRTLGFMDYCLRCRAQMLVFNMNAVVDFAGYCLFPHFLWPIGRRKNCTYNRKRGRSTWRASGEVSRIEWAPHGRAFVASSNSRSIKAIGVCVYIYWFQACCVFCKPIPHPLEWINDKHFPSQTLSLYDMQTRKVTFRLTRTGLLLIGLLPPVFSVWARLMVWLEAVHGISS